MADYDPKWADAISSIESSGDYNQVTPSPGGRAAYGKYQVMGENIPEWTKAALGKSMSPQEFTANPDAQDAVFKHRFGGYVDQYGSPQDAASAWFTGKPINAQSAAASDRFGTTGASYVNKFNRAMSAPDGSTAIQNAMGQRPSTGSAMGFAPDDTTQGALSPQPNPGALSANPPANSWINTLGQTLMDMAPGLASASNPAAAAALQAAAEAHRKAAQGNPGSWSAGPVNKKTGMILMTNTNGQTKFVQSGAAPDDQADWVHFGKDANGDDHWGPRPTDEEYAAQQKAQAAAPPPSAFFGDDTKPDGPEFYKTVDPVHRAIIDGWHAGTGMLPSPRDVGKNDMQKLMATAAKAYPDMDMQNLPARQRLAKTLTDSAATSNGGIITNSNAAARILNDAADQHLALHNAGDYLGSSGLGNINNWVSNKAANSKRADIIRHLEGNGDDASGEITKVLTGGPGGVDERKVRSNRIANPNYVPSEAAGALEGEVNDLAAKHRETVDKVRQQMGQSYLDRFPVIEKNFNNQEAQLRSKIEQLRGGGAPIPAGQSRVGVPQKDRPPLTDIFK